MTNQNRGKGRAWLLGVGLDNDDGHTRLTRGDNFILAGGSEETHDKMTEGAMKLNESLKKCGKQLDDVTKEEFVDLAHKSGLVDDPRRN